MQIVFYNNISDDTAVPKTLNTLNTLTGTVKEKLDLLNPSILVTSNIPLTANYMYIPALRRYYFCTIEIVREDLYRVTGRVDVLQSFWTDIKNAPCILQRSRSLYNAFIADNQRKFYQYSRTQYINIGGALLPDDNDLGKPDTPILITVG